MIGKALDAPHFAVGQHHNKDDIAVTWIIRSFGRYDQGCFLILSWIIADFDRE
jgi:hypothetical protein